LNVFFKFKDSKKGYELLHSEGAEEGDDSIEVPVPPPVETHTKTD
jgi:hypothetical protein